MKNKKIYPWIVVGLLWVVALLNYMDRQMLSTMKTAMEIDIVELQKAEHFGNLMAIFLFIYALMSPFSGIIADRTNRKWLIVGSLFIWSTVTYGMGLSTNFTQLLWLRGIMGLSEALYIPAALSLIADYHTGKTRSLAIGIHMTGLYAGQAIGGFGATIAAAYSWNLSFHWFGIIGILYAVVLSFFLKEKKIDYSKSTNKQQETNYKIPLKKGLVMIFSMLPFWIILFYFAAPSLPGWATKNWLPTLFSESLNIPMSQAGPISTISIALSSFIGVIFGGILSDKWVQKNIRGRVYTGAIGLALTIPSLIFLGYGNSFITIIGAALLFGIGFGMFDANNMPILCQFVPQKLRATAYGFMNTVGVLAGAGITSVLGRMTDNGDLGFGFAILAGVVLLAIILQITFLKPTVDNMK